ncbi:PA14 domain-containing protein [Thermocatellispora tengchongensis]|uniref:PA14 domain-containing protein n=1 Tax=Thermocatellispora tengchongensis TaxID=1073253 RepID=UPI003629D1AE
MLQTSRFVHFCTRNEDPLDDGDTTHPPNPLLLLLGLLLGLAHTVVGTTAARADEPVADKHGLRGDYYLQSRAGAFDFAELKATVVDPNIEMADLNPVFQTLTGRSDDVSVRWTGRIEPKLTQTYTFSMVGDNGYRLWVNNQLIIDHWVDDWDIEQVGTPIALEAGKKYDFKIEYFEHFGGANLRLRWQAPGLEKQIVPAEAFYLPEGFDPPGPESAAVDESGQTVTLDFAEDLAPLPQNAHQHLVTTVSGTAYPATSAALKDGDPSVVLLKLTYPVPMQAGNTVRTAYDGQGGITTAAGAPLEEYKQVGVANGSRYTLHTPWTDDVDARNPLPEYPRPQLRRDDWRSLNGTWQFAGAAQGEAPPFGKDLAEKIVVPFPVESLLSGVQRHEERMFYRRTFKVPGDWKGDRLLLHLDAVDWEATVYVNGKQVGTHKGGYDRFTVDVTDVLSRAASRSSSSPCTTRPTAAASRSASSGSTPAASGTPRSPASGSRCGWSRWRRPGSTRSSSPPTCPAAR